MWRTSAFITLARLGGAGIAILTQLLVARTVGAQGLGTYYLALSGLAILSMLGSLGLPWIMPSLVAREDKNAARLSAIFALARAEAAKASLVFAGLALVVVWATPWVDAQLRLPMSLAVLSVPATTQMRMYGALANARRRFALAYMPELVVRPVLVFAVAVVLMFLAPAWAVPGLLLANFASTALLGLAQGRMLNQAAPNAGPVPEVSSIRTDYAAHRGAALPMVAATLFLAIFADLDVMVAGFFLDTHNLGLFSAALRMSMFVGFFVQAGHQIIMRDLADAMVGGDRVRMGQAIGLSNLSNLAVSGLALVGAVIAGRTVLCLFGADFVAAYPALILLVGAQMARAAAGPGVQMLAIANKTGQSAPVFVMAGVLLVATNAFLIPLWGVFGAALAVALTIGFWTVAISLMATRVTGVAAFGLAWPRRRVPVLDPS